MNMEWLGLAYWQFGPCICVEGLRNIAKILRIVSLFERLLNPAPPEYEEKLLTTRSVAPKVCSADPKGSTTSFQGTREYISVMATLKFSYFLIKEIMFC
jgi:hypothetical protein